MMDVIIWFGCVWGCAILFIGIGFYAERREKPMWFWAAGIIYVFNVKIALGLLILSCTVGIIQLYRTYKIMEKNPNLTKSILGSYVQRIIAFLFCPDIL